MIKRRDGTPVQGENGQDRLLALLYGNAVGRMLLKPLVCPAVSRAAGRFLSSKMSCFLIRPFIRKNGIDMQAFEPVRYASYNEFFSRKIRPEMRPVDQQPEHLISPCDSKLTVLRITPACRFTLKHTEYTVASLLKNQTLAEAYQGGYALVFRLTVDDYHRYCYPFDGEKEANVRIPGILHTVNPIANDYYPIYKENAREYTLVHNPVFGDVLMMEVGALLVGRIVNHHQKATVHRGQEKGFFQFGGSTVVMLIEKDRVEIDEELLRHSDENIETIVRMGEKIGRAVQR